jgi:hypothetical protein
VSLEQGDELLVFSLEATAFLRHIVRNIGGVSVTDRYHFIRLGS